MSNEVTIAEVFGFVLRHKWLAIVAFLACLALGVSSIVLEVPRYRATVVAMPASPMGGEQRSQAGGLSGLAALTGIRFAGESVGLQETLAVLQSRSFTEAFITRHDLLPVLFAESWDSAEQAWLDEIENPPSMDDAVRFFDRNVRYVEFDDSTRIIRVHIEWTNRFVAADWANALLDQLNEMIRSRAIEEASRAETFLYKELESTTNIEVERAIYELIERNVQKVMYANVNQEYALKIIDPAVVVDPERKVNMSRNLKLALSLILGAIMAVVVSVLANIVAVSRSRSE